MSRVTSSHEPRPASEERPRGRCPVEGQEGVPLRPLHSKNARPRGQNGPPPPGFTQPLGESLRPRPPPTHAHARGHPALRRGAGGTCRSQISYTWVQPRPTSCSRMPTPSHTLPVGAHLSTSFGVKHWSLDPQFPRKLVGRLNFQRSAIRLSNLPLALSDSISTPGDPKTSSEPRSIDSGETIQFRPLLRGDI